jgi:amino acid transporter
MAAQAMWFGILAAFLLCLATGIAYSELSKLYPGLASSYFFAEQAFLSQNKTFRFAGIAKFVVGWASHLYYWVYPGLMCGVAALIAGYGAGQIWPGTFNAAVPSPLFMIIFCPLFAFGVAYMCRRGVTGTTAFNAAINVIQISALVGFSIIAVAYRLNHPQGTAGISLDRSSAPITKFLTQDGNQDFTVDYSNPIRLVTESNYPDQAMEKFEYHSSAVSVIAPHRFSFAIVQACISILILVGFESVTWMGEEAAQPKRDIPRAVILSLLIQGLVCYLIEYFAANFFLHNGYPLSKAVNSAAPIADMMIIAGTWLFGSASAGKAFMLVQMLTVFLALVGTTLASMNIATRVSYVMGRDREASRQSRFLRAERVTPHRIIWILAGISTFIAITSVIFVFCGPASLGEDVIKALPRNAWYSFGIFEHDLAARIPQSLIVVALVSNFGTFLLYMMTCVLAIVAFREHHTFNGLKHAVIPLFGVLANLLCLSFYVIGPFMVDGMSAKEPAIALSICGLWGLGGWIYFKRAIKKVVPLARSR